MEKTTIYFNVIDLNSTDATTCPLLLGSSISLFNDADLTRLKGKYYKAVMEGHNIVTFYYRDTAHPHSSIAYRYVVAVNWLKTDDRLSDLAHTPYAVRIAERIAYQRLLSMVKLINTNNI